mmetsp:Transcript_3747/g.5835  ORF Transcript_3747/g.5835 Transcript_3747/m.5835 type:complete len:234 (+) Transcript_3747:75-776(+)
MALPSWGTCSGSSAWLSRELCGSSSRWAWPRSWWRTSWSQCVCNRRRCRISAVTLYRSVSLKRPMWSRVFTGRLTRGIASWTSRMLLRAWCQKRRLVARSLQRICHMPLQARGVGSRNRRSNQHLLRRRLGHLSSLGCPQSQGSSSTWRRCREQSRVPRSRQRRWRFAESWPVQPVLRGSSLLSARLLGGWHTRRSLRSPPCCPGSGQRRGPKLGWSHCRFCRRLMREHLLAR